MNRISSMNRFRQMNTEFYRLSGVMPAGKTYGIPAKKSRKNGSLIHIFRLVDGASGIRPDTFSVSINRKITIQAKKYRKTPFLPAG